MTPLVVPARFNGPPDSGNGGYTCGLIAARAGGPAVVTLRSPPPLDSPMEVSATADGIAVHHDGRLIAEAAAPAGDLAAPGPVPFDVAASVSVVPDVHPFPTCFVCGPRRGDGDGLRLFVGNVPGSGTVAAPWTVDAAFAPDGRAAPEIVWAALDCPGGWVGDRDFGLLGRLDGRIFSRPEAGERCVVVARQAGQRTDRKWHAETAVYGAGGGLHAVGFATWIIPRG